MTDIADKIGKLRRMTVANSATEAEQDAAARRIGLLLMAHPEIEVRARRDEGVSEIIQQARAAHAERMRQQATAEKWAREARDFGGLGSIFGGLGDILGGQRK